MVPRWALEGSIFFFARFTRCASALLGSSWALLGSPLALLGVQEAILRQMLGLGWLASGVQGGRQTLRCQKHAISTLRRNQCLLIVFWRQEAFRKLATWLFGGHVVGLMPGREQLEGHVDFKVGSTREVGASDQPNLFQGASMLCAT